jgi:putative membrane protein
MTTTDTLVRTLLVLVIAVLLIPILMMILFVPLMGMAGWGHMGQWTETGGMGWIGIIMWLGFLFLILGGGYLVYRTIVRSNTQAPDAALEELRIAYARGDLSDEEFEQRRDRLQEER